MTDRRTLHTLVDGLPEGALGAAERYLESLRQPQNDPLKALLDAAPDDDEPLDDDDLRAIRQGFEEKSRGDVLSHEEVKRRLRESW